MGVAAGFIGNSNCYGIADWAKNPSPIDPSDLLDLLFFNVDFYDVVDDAGTFRPMVFRPSAVDPVLSAYDYQPNLGAPALNPVSGVFGPEIYSGIILREHLGTQVPIVKLANGGQYLKANALGTARPAGSWFWPICHNSFDVTVAHSTTPYTATVVDSGTASSIATTVSPFSLLTDGTKSWVPNSLVDHYVVRGGSFGRIVANTATTALVEFYVPNMYGSPPAAGAYTIEVRAAIQASMGKAFIDGYCVGALAADPTFDLQLVCIVLGETEALTLDRANASKDAMLELIWYIRNQAVANGVTSLEAHQVGIVLALVRENESLWPFASTVNDGFREIAESDPHVRVVQTKDLPVGGFEIPGIQDDVHYNAIGQAEFGARVGMAFLDLLSVSSTAPRASTHYQGRHVTVRPIWGPPASSISRWVATGTQLSSFGSAVDMPAAYASRDGEQGASELVVDDSGLNIGAGFSGTRWGYGLRGRGVAMERAESLQIQVARSRVPSGGSIASANASGHVWPAGRASSGFAEQEQSVVSGSDTHVIRHAANCADKVTRWETAIGASPSVEWMRRGYNGAMGISGMLQIDEIVGTQSTQWMRHRLSHGDSSRAQTQGRGWSKMPPTLPGEGVALEYGCDELSPYPWAPSVPLPALSSDQVKLIHDHGGLAANGDAVLWPGVLLGAQVDTNWYAIPGCFRVVHSLIADFVIGNALDTLSFQQRVFVDQSKFDHQFTYDPATSTKASLTTVGNYTRTFRVADYDEIDPSYALISTAAGPFSKGSGVVGFEKVGGLVVGLYMRMRRGSQADIDEAFSLTASGNTVVANDPNYASYDQLSYAYLMQVATAAGVVIQPNTTTRWAIFILVGSLATVQAAADALHAMDVDASWVD